MSDVNDRFPHLCFHTNDDGSVSVAQHDCWVSALFESLEAARSWAEHLVEAEESFAAVNAATGGKGSLLLGVRGVVSPDGAGCAGGCPA